MNDFEKQLLECPWDNDLRGVYSDYLQEHGDEFFQIHRFLYNNNVRPFVHDQGLTFFNQGTFSPFSLPQAFIGEVSFWEDSWTWFNSQKKGFREVILSKWRKQNLDAIFTNTKPVFVKKDIQLYCDDSEDPYYGRDLRKVSEPTSNDFYVLEARVGEWHLPTLDIDSSFCVDKAKRIIDLNKIPYALLESTPGHFWVILDLPSKNFSSLDLVINNIPGIDPKYLNITKRRRSFILRAVPKGVLPKFLFSNLENEITKYFLDMFLAHWEKPSIQKIKFPVREVAY